MAEFTSFWSNVFSQNLLGMFQNEFYNENLEIVNFVLFKTFFGALVVQF